MNRFHSLTLCVFFCLTGCGRQSTLQENQTYLRSIAAHIINFQNTKGALPQSIDECLAGLSITLPHRGDVDGRTLHYRRLGNNGFFLCSVGVNGEFEYGKGDDVELIYLNGREIPRD